MSRRARTLRETVRLQREQQLRAALRKPRPDRPCVELERELGRVLDALVRAEPPPVDLSPAAAAIAEQLCGDSTESPVRLERMLDLACVLRTRGRKLLSMKPEENPYGFEVIHYPLLLGELAKHPWLRSPMTWRPRGKRRWTLFVSLASHLLGYWPIAPALFSAFQLAHRDRPGEDAICIPLLVHIARGGSRAAAVEQGLTPGPITRRGWHAFLRSPVQLDFIRAFRRAQLIGLGVSRVSADRVVRHHACTLRDVDEADLYEQFRWLAKHDLNELTDREIDRILTVIQLKKDEDATWSLTGRTPRSLLVLWRREFCWTEHPRYSRIAPAESFPQPARELVLDGEPRCDASGRPWSVQHIATFDELRREGRAMRHCVAWYADDALRGRRSFWSLRLLDQRRLTLELDHRAGKVVQAKGKLNREPTEEEQAVLTRLAA